MTCFDVPPADPRLYAVLAEAGFGDELFNPRQHRVCELVERYALALAVELSDRLGVTASLDEPRTVDELIARAGWAASFAGPLRWLLECLARDGLIVRAGGRYHLRAALPAPPLAALRAEILAADGSYGPALALLDEAAAIYPRVARGETTAEQVLFRKAALWFAYFSNEHRYYAINNRVAAAAAVTRLRDGAAVLEVGAGLGSASEALLEALAGTGALGRLRAYRVTEPVALFRRRAERTLAARWPGLPLAFDGVDINRPWRDQDVAPGSLDLVWGVNVFHLARDLDAVLADARRALAPGGWLVAGEGMRPSPTTPVGAELPFQILESYVDATLDPERRPMPGFLTAEQWIAALTRAGLAPVELVPDAIRMRAIHPTFFSAAVCGRRT